MKDYRPPSIRDRAREQVRADGLRLVAANALRWLAQYAAGLPRTAAGAGDSFTYAGAPHRYLVHRYNWTWLNERAVEVPIARAAIARAGAGQILEVGNVLGHYGTTGHVVIDRYERAPGVINSDVLGFGDERGFDLIVSVSTLEHVGWDEVPRDPDAAARAFDHLRGLLLPGGELLATVPAGYNPALDAAIRDGRLSLTELRALRREARRNVWREVDPPQAFQTPYDHLLCTAHAILVCTARRPSGS